MQIEILRGDLSIWRELRSIYKTAYENSEEYSLKRESAIKRYLKWLYKRDKNGLFIAKANGKTVGFLFADANWWSKEEGAKVGAIHELAILPEYQRRGIGMKLLNIALDYLIKSGHSKIETWVGCENKAGLAISGKAGFKERDRKAKWVRLVKEV
ncbi:MAG: GNAT family N-acetyltransferase [Methanocellales archaeon]